MIEKAAELAIQVVTDTSTVTGTEAAKWEFLNIVFLSVAIGDALKHNKTYASTATEDDRKSIRRELSSAMVELAEKYKVPVTEADHRENLTALEERVTENCGSFLVGGKVRTEGHLRRGRRRRRSIFISSSCGAWAGYRLRHIARLTTLSSGNCRRNFRVSSGRRLILRGSTTQ